MIFFLLTLVSLSSPQIALNETVTVTLTFESGQVPDIDVARTNLLYSYPFGVTPPFALKEERVNLPLYHLTLEPKTLGEHLLTFGKIPLKGGGVVKPESVMITVTPVTIDPFFLEHPAPLARLDIPYPIELDAEQRKALFQTQKITLPEFPWEKILGFFIFLVALIAIRMQPKREEKKEVEKEDLAQAFLMLKENKDYVFQANRIFKEAMEEQFSIKAKAKTKEELKIAILKNQTFSEKEKISIIDFFELIEKIKFDQKPLTNNLIEKGKLAAAALKLY
jgi:hypothetical protein